MTDGKIRGYLEESETDRTQEESQALPSRRGFLSGSAKLLGGGALALALGGGTALAQEVEPRAQGTGVIRILNYALVLERLEYEFYRRMLKRFGEGQIENADIFEGLGRGVRKKIHENFVRIREHEETHVETLVSVIKQLGGDPLPDSEYDFGVRSVADFARTAAVLENTGVSAYDGAIAYIGMAKIRTAGATIATVEARHASYLNLITGEVPAPDAFDEPKTPQEICELVEEAFITSSPYNLRRFCNSLPDRVIAP